MIISTTSHQKQIISSLGQGPSPWNCACRTTAGICSVTNPSYFHDWLTGNSLVREDNTINHTLIWPGRHSSPLRRHIFAFIHYMLLLWLISQKATVSRILAKQGGGVQWGVLTAAPHMPHAGPLSIAFLLLVCRRQFRVLTTLCTFPPTSLCWYVLPQGITIPKLPPVLKLPLVLKVQPGAQLSLVCPKAQVKIITIAAPPRPQKILFQSFFI